MTSTHAPAGPLLFGYASNVGLYGLLSVQIYIYYAAFPRDAILIKSLVYSVFLIETAKTIIMIYDFYDIFVIGFGDTTSLHSIHHIWLTCCIVNGILAFIVQILYAYRIRVLSASYTLGLFITSLSIVQLAGSLVSGIGGKLVGRTDLSSFGETVGYMVSKISGAVCDITIACLMTYYLLRMRTTSPMPDDIITRIVRLVVQAGTLTSLCAIIDVLLYFVDSKDGSSWAFRLIIGKLYSNSMMVVFNSRFSIRNRRYDTSEATWRSISVPVDVDSMQQIDTETAFNHIPGSFLGSQWEPDERSLSRTNSITSSAQKDILPSR